LWRSALCGGSADAKLFVLYLVATDTAQRDIE